MAAKKKILRYERDKPNDYRPHEDGSLPFQAFVESDQMREPLLEAGQLIITYAKASVPPSDDERNGHYADAFDIGSKTKVLYKPKRFPAALRAMVEVINTADHAAALEFGSGEGSTDAEYRPQGGGNLPKRPLGRAAARVGDFHE